MAEENSTGYSIEEVDKVNFRDTLIKDPKIFAERILKSETVTCSITLPVQQHVQQDGNWKTTCITTTIPFYMSSDFSVGDLSNDWQDLVNIQDNVFAQFLNATGAFSGESQVTLQSEAMSSQVWKGSRYGGFSVECLFVSTRRTINPTKIIRMLAAASLPTVLEDSSDQTTAKALGFAKQIGGALIEGGRRIANYAIDGASAVMGGLNNTLGTNVTIDSQGAKNNVNETAGTLDKLVEGVGLVAPLHYGIDLNSTTGASPIKNTTVTLNVGEWFEASELLVESISGIQFSKEIIAPPSHQGLDRKKGNDLYDPSADGEDYAYPLWGKCTIKFKPSSMMHLHKFQGYFKDKTSDGIMNILKGYKTSILGTGISEMFRLPS